MFGHIPPAYINHSAEARLLNKALPRNRSLLRRALVPRRPVAGTLGRLALGGMAYSAFATGKHSRAVNFDMRDAMSQNPTTMMPGMHYPMISSGGMSPNSRINTHASRFSRKYTPPLM